MMAPLLSILKWILFLSLIQQSQSFFLIQLKKEKFGFFRTLFFYNLNTVVGVKTNKFVTLNWTSGR